ncbi:MULTISPECIES: hypothetical protein [unclassified Gilliamella]|uniref:hypothetical protein n=1 Tax=unclassified Gilliamella TaxID=2685620 RepID=UPI00080E0CA8|nr:hypothetical protein [Gilliamella apicola]OCG35754.1 hypothetical protein A9G32_06720 [Gilliamella apicola]OCG50741.1 hypothetical protein A9G26_05930 [Gilliamella apicola]OCG54266.1 hypothetical protein A9G27_07215 [Gilliamella apicola]
MKSNFLQTICATVIGGLISAFVSVVVTYYIPKLQQEEEGKKWLQIFAVEIEGYHGSDIICERIQTVKKKIKEFNNTNPLENRLITPDSELNLPSIYKSNLDKIGLLKSENAENIMNFHTYFNNSLIIFSESSIYNKVGFNKKTLNALLEQLTNAEKYRKKVLGSANIKYESKCEID